MSNKYSEIRKKSRKYMHVFMYTKSGRIRKKAFKIIKWCKEESINILYPKVYKFPLESNGNFYGWILRGKE